MKISLIIATYNNPVFLEMVLLTVKSQKLNAEYYSNVEIIIADDGSTRDTKILIDKYSNILPFKLKHIWHEDNGFRLAAIRNLAVKNSTGEYLVFLDCDCLLAEDFIANQLLLREKGFCVAGNRVLLSQQYTAEITKTLDVSITQNNFIQNILFKLTGKTNKLLTSLRLSPNAAWRKSRIRDWKMPKGCNFALWHEDYIKVNGFDESFSGWGHEDSDIAVRLLHAGVLIKDGRFAVSVFHLWHKENSRARKNINYDKLMQRIADKNFIQAEIGIKPRKSS